MFWNAEVWQTCKNVRNQEGGKHFFTPLFFSLILPKPQKVMCIAEEHQKDLKDSWIQHRGGRSSLKVLRGSIMMLVSVFSLSARVSVERKLPPGERWRRSPPPRARWTGKKPKIKVLKSPEQFPLQSTGCDWSIYKSEDQVGSCIKKTKKKQRVDRDIWAHHQFNKPLAACFHWTQHLYQSPLPCQ